VELPERTRESFLATQASGLGKRMEESCAFGIITRPFSAA
jgi:hypothetical protein